MSVLLVFILPGLNTEYKSLFCSLAHFWRSETKSGRTVLSNEVHHGTDDNDVQEFIRLSETVCNTNESSQQYKEHVV